MSSIKNVALVGKGNVGSAVLGELTKSGFNVTVLSRSAAEEPNPGIKTIQVDYTSVNSLASALKGQDAVVSTMGAAGTSNQKTLIDALFQTISEYLKEKAAAGHIEYSILATGPFLDFVFGGPLFVDVHSRSVEFLGDGSLRLSSTSIGGIAKAAAGTLKNAENTKNRVIHIQETVVSQTKILELAKKAFPDKGEWNLTSIGQEEAVETATANLCKNPNDVSTIYGLIKAVMMSGRYETEYHNLDNDVVGLKQLSDEDVERQFVPLMNKTAY